MTSATATPVLTAKEHLTEIARDTVEGLALLTTARDAIAARNVENSNHYARVLTQSITDLERALNHLDYLTATLEGAATAPKFDKETYPD